MGCASSNDSVEDSNNNSYNTNSGNNDNAKSVGNTKSSDVKSLSNDNKQNRSRSASPKKSARRGNSTSRGAIINGVNVSADDEDDDDLFDNRNDTTTKKVKDTYSKTYSNLCASYNRVGYIPSFPEKENQNGIIRFQNLYGVLNGHGEYGKDVSNHIISLLPKAFKDINTSIATDANSALTASVRYLSEKLNKSSINTYLSGATMCLSYIDDKNIYTANIGNCKCIIGRYNSESGEIVAKVLTSEHTCDNKEENNRILDSGGRVKPLIGVNGDDSGPNRIWLADVDVPGLLITRSLGDRLAQSIGVTWAPEIRTNKRNDDDCFILWATPSLFEFMSNRELMKLIQQFLYNEKRSVLETLRLIIGEARRRWRDEEEVVDDVSCLLLQIKEDL